MRAFIALLVAVVILVASASAVSGLNINLQATQNLANAPTDTHSNGARMLRADVTTGESIDEERGIADIAKKLGTKAKSFMKDRYDWLYVYWKSSAMNQDETAKLFLKKNIHPDKLRKWLGADKPSDRLVNPEQDLFFKYNILWNSVHKK
ncbi:RxLR effector protein [Phytophthora ramorum]|uniref:RxLR effector protein n=1 Tax=Phytophthora ramorum TaxID=164328 RepID=UPI0030A1AF5F|nr:RxLR effector protein [Phytophthora ramorum]